MVNGIVSTSRPTEFVPKEELASKIEQWKAAALAKAKELIKAEKLVIRDLSWEDLGVSGNEWKFDLTSAGENTIVNKELDDKTLILIYAVGDKSDSPVVTKVTFGTPAHTVQIIELESAYVTDYPEKVIDNPPVFTPGQKMVIKAIATGSATGEKIYFRGFVVEPKGKNIG